MQNLGGFNLPNIDLAVFAFDQVIGSGAPGKAALAATEDSGFFVCQVNNSPHEVSSFSFKTRFHQLMIF